MPRDTRNIGLAFLLSALIVVGVATACSFLFAPIVTTASACQQHYTVACLI